MKTFDLNGFTVNNDLNSKRVILFSFKYIGITIRQCFDSILSDFTGADVEWLDIITEWNGNGITIYMYQYQTSQFVPVQSEYNLIERCRDEWNHNQFLIAVVSISFPAYVI